MAIGFRRPALPGQDLERDALLNQMKRPEAPVGEAMPDKGMPMVKPEEPLRMSGPNGDFDGSGYGTASGYLQAATKWLEPQVRAAKSEQEAKNLVQNYLQSIQPELEKRGAKVGKIRNEAITLDGREYDTFEDIGGKSNAQLLELGLPGGGGPAMGAGYGAMGMGGSAAPSAMRALAPTDMGTYEELQRRLMEILGGDQAFDREALLAQMKR